MLTKLSGFKPNPASDTPLYMQLANMLSDGIASGDWRANQALPSEPFDNPNGAGMRQPENLADLPDGHARLMADRDEGCRCFPPGAEGLRDRDPDPVGHGLRERGESVDQAI